MNVTWGKHFTELVADFDVVTRENTQALVDTLTSIIEPDTSAKLLIQVIGAKAMPGAAQTLSTWVHTQQKLLRGAQLAYVVTGRSHSGEAQLLSRAVAGRELQLRVFNRRAPAVDWLTNTRRELRKRSVLRTYS